MHGKECLEFIRDMNNREMVSPSTGELPVDGRSPNWTICLSDTPVAGKLA